MTEIITKVRNLIGDALESCKDYYQMEDKYSFVLEDIPDSPAVEDSIQVFKNDVEVEPTNNWSYSASTNKITFEQDSAAEELTAGDLIVITYSSYKKYSLNEMKGYIRAAISNLSIYGYRTFKEKSDIIYPTPIESEENLIAVIASILIIGSIKQYKTAEITFTFADDTSKEDKIRQAINQYSKTFGTITYNDMDDYHE